MDLATMSSRQPPPPSEPRGEAFLIEDDQQVIFTKNSHNEQLETDDSRNSCVGRMMDPLSRSFRFIVLFFNCIFTLGPYFCYDMPTTLQGELQRMPNKTCESLRNGSADETCCSDCLGLSSTEFNLLFSVFSWVNAITVIFTGFLTDKLGNRVALLIFSTVTLLGTSLFAVATIAPLRQTRAILPMMLIGRMMLGSGNGGMRIVQDRVTAFWFRDKELAMAFGIMLSFSRLGSVLNFLVTTTLYSFLGITWTFFFGAGLCAVGLVSAVALSALDLYGIRKLGQEALITTQSKKVKPADIRHFPCLFWVLTATIAMFYSSVMPFIANSSKYFQDEYHFSKHSSAYISGAVYDVALVLSPICGLILDKFGRRGKIAVVCTSLVIPIYLVFLFTNIHPLYMTILLGFSYTLSAICLWPSVTLVVGSASLGTAMGVATFCLGTGRGISNVVVGKLLENLESINAQEKSKKWSNVLIYFICNASVAIICAVLLNVVDYFKDQCLDKAKNKGVTELNATTTDSGNKESGGRVN